MAAAKTAKKRARAPSGRKSFLLEIPIELLDRVEGYTDKMVEADPYRQRSRNAALLVLIDAGLEAKGVAK